MWNLVKEALGETFCRPMRLLKCFWPILIYAPLILGTIGGALYWFFSSASLDNIGRTGLLLFLVALVSIISFVVALSAATCAVRWHRHIVLGETLDWAFPWPTKKWFSYSARLAVFLGTFVVMQQLGDFIWSNHFELAMWSFVANGNSGFLGTLFILAGAPIGFLFVTAVFTLITGHFMLVLPAAAVDQSSEQISISLRGVGRWQFLGALYLLYCLPYAAEIIARLLTRKSSLSLEIMDFWMGLGSMLIGYFSSMAVLSLLSITYRRNLQFSSAAGKLACRE
jgi:hypothetical protein